MSVRGPATTPWPLSNFQGRLGGWDRAALGWLNGRPCIQSRALSHSVGTEEMAQLRPREEAGVCVCVRVCGMMLKALDTGSWSQQARKGLSCG